MSKLVKIGEFLQQGTSFFQPSPDRFPPVDAGRLEEQVQLVERAKERGQEDQPPSSAEGPDIVEQEILHTVNDLAERARSVVLRNLKGYAGRISANNLSTKSFDIQTTAKDATAEFSVAVRDGVNRLTLHLERVRNMHTERTAFRQKNCLTRPAEEPVAPIFAIALILVVAVVETALNTNFFATGNDAGLLGGLIESFLVTLGNVGVGFLVGRGIWPWKNHINRNLRLTAYSGMLGHPVLSIAWNLLVSQYRLSLQDSSVVNPGTEALKNFIHSPLHVADFQSVMMILLGVGAALFAAYEGYKMRDPYPQYSKVERNYRLLAEQYAYYQNLVIQDLKDIKDKAIRTLTSLKDEIPRTQIELETILASKEHLLQEYRDYISHLGRVAVGLVTTYRDINSKERKTARPAYFDVPPSIDLSSEINDQNELTIDMKEQAGFASSAAQNLDQASEMIFADFRDVQERFPLLEDIFKGRRE